MNRNQFSEVYEKWMAMREWEYGPGISPKPEVDEEEFHRLMVSLVASLPDSLDALKEGSKVILLRSPWEASLLLSVLQDSLGKTHDRMIFRGQKRSDWNLIASVDRLKNDKQKFDKTLLEYLFFGALLGNLHVDLTLLTGDDSSFKLAIPSSAYFPIAQHYGAPSPLLDFTADPAVAVYFASRDSEDFHEKSASVYCYRVSTLENNPKLANFSFAPPFFERPYLQKGIFVEMPAGCDDFRDIIEPDLVIQFPVLADNCEFKIVRERNIDLEPEINEMVVLKDLAKKGVSRMAMDHAGQTFYEDQIYEYVEKYVKGLRPVLQTMFKEHLKNPMDYLWRFVDSVEDMLYWLCYHVVDGGLAVNQGALDLVVKCNPEIFRAMISMYNILIESRIGYSLPSDKVDGKMRFVQMFEESLKRSNEKTSLSPNDIFESLKRSISSEKACSGVS